MKENKYAIWLKPSRSEYESLIIKYSNIYRTPLFEPHVTLLSSIKGMEGRVKKKVKKLAQCMKPFKVKINKASHSSSYYKCVVLELAKECEILRSREKAKGIFKILNEREYEPHVSIVYGELKEEKRKRIVAEIDSEIGRTTMVESICLIQASSDMPPVKWRKIEEYALNDGKLHKL